MWSDNAQMGVGTPVAHQVVVYLHAFHAVGRDEEVAVALVVAHHGGNLRSVVVTVLDNHVGIVVIVLKRPALGLAVLIANIKMVVAAREVAVLDAPQRALGLSLGDGLC